MKKKLITGKGLKEGFDIILYNKYNLSKSTN